MITALCLFSGIAVSFVKISISRQRRIYWSCTALGAVSGFFCGYPDVGRGLGVSVCVVVAMIFGAMRATPYLKIGGKVYAFSARDRQARDDDIPDTFTEDLAHAADILQRRYGDDDIPDTTGRNTSETLNALRRRSADETTEQTEHDATDAASPAAPPPDHAAPPVRVAVPDAGGGVRLRVFNVLIGLSITLGGALMAINPPPPVHRSPQAFTGIGFLCVAVGIYLVVNALRAPAPADTAQPTLAATSAHPHRHAVRTPIGQSAKLAAMLLGACAAGGGLLWWGITAGLWSVVGMSVILLGPILVIFASSVTARRRAGH